MANVRIAQIGQTQINRPFYEVVTGNSRCVLATDSDGKLRPKNRAWLRAMGVASVVAETFQDTATVEILRGLAMGSDMAITPDYRFKGIALGTGLSWVSDFKPATGWVGLFPSVKFNADF